MSFNSIKTKAQSERGFTIVELLIVIVVIGILAAITIVAYNGVTARANTTSAQAAASSALKKIEAYNAEESTYPLLQSAITAASVSGKSYYLTGITFVQTTLTAKPSTNSTLFVERCGAATPVTAATGARATYWNFQTSAAVVVSTGTTTACEAMPAS